MDNENENLRREVVRLLVKVDDANTERDRANWAFNDLYGKLEQGEASDGFHTHNDLYEARALLCALAWRGLLAAGVPVMRSWKHSDGQWCFGTDHEREWFIVVADLPGVGQVSFHYPAREWDLFAGVPEVETPIGYDGHTTADVYARPRRWLTGYGAESTDA